MKVIYTRDIFSRQSVGGISRYYVELIRQLSAQGANISVLAGTHSNRFLGELDGNPVICGRYQANTGRRGIVSRLTGRRGSDRLGVAELEAVVHHTYYSFRRPTRSGRLAVTVHDMIPERFPGQFGWKARFLALAKRRSCAQADLIFVISETTKADLVNWHGIDPDRIHVTYLGNSLLPYRDVNEAAPMERPYILYVGSRQGYKNCRTLFEAFGLSPKLKQNFSLLCFGGGPLTKREKETLHQLGIAENVRQAGGSDRELANSYRHAAAYVCPSIYEGFGIPAVEAMSFGCPVVASDRGSLPEVIGPAGVYFDPSDSRMLAELLENVIEDSGLQQELKEEMRSRESRYRWENTARETLRGYEKIAA